MLSSFADLRRVGQKDDRREEGGVVATPPPALMVKPKGGRLGLGLEHTTTGDNKEQRERTDPLAVPRRTCCPNRPRHMAVASDPMDSTVDTAARSASAGSAQASRSSPSVVAVALACCVCMYCRYRGVGTTSMSKEERGGWMRLHT